MADTIVKAYQIDERAVLLITSTGVRIYHEIGNDKVDAEAAYKEFLAKGGKAQPKK
jgi:hypothetical protein